MLQYSNRHQAQIDGTIHKHTGYLRRVILYERHLLHYLRPLNSVEQRLCIEIIDNSNLYLLQLI
jgi:hypothetical protein